MGLGKFICAALGFSLGAKMGFLGGIIGALVGYSIGDMFDSGLKRDDQANFSLYDLGDETRNIFFASTFSVMGFIAKSDGRVSESEIQAAESIMSRLGLTAQLREQAIYFFQQGKNSEFRWTVTADKLLKSCGPNRNLLQLFLEIQIETAFAEGVATDFKQKLLLKIGDWLGFKEYEVKQLIQMYLASTRFYHQGKSQHSSTAKNTHQVGSLADAYQILGVNRNDDKKTITRAYRKLISQHHPDKLVSKGLPEEMIKIANEKTSQIKKAYEKICDARGF